MKKKVFKNLGWKLGGLLLAFILWFHLATEQDFSKKITVDIDYINLHDNFKLSDESRKTAIIELSATGKKLFKLLYFEDIKLEIDLSNYTIDSNYSITFTTEQVVLPSGIPDVDIRFIGPRTCDFELIQLQ